MTTPTPTPRSGPAATTPLQDVSVVVTTPLSADTLVFSSDRTGTQEVYTMKTDGSQHRQLTVDSRYDSWWARISPDRRRILFYRKPKGVFDEEQKQASLWMMNVDGSNVRELRPAGTDGWEMQGHAEWSPDGRQLVMSGGRGINPYIYVTDADGKNPRQTVNRGGRNIDPSWSPDGSTILFIGCASFICFEKDFEIFSVPATGGDARQLTSNNLRDHDPYYSPDGRSIVWVAETEPNAFKAGIGVWNMFMMASDGTNQRRVTDDRQINATAQWARDGSRLYFHRFEPGKQDRWGVFVVRPDGTGLTEITTGAPGNSEFPSL